MRKSQLSEKNEFSQLVPNFTENVTAEKPRLTLVPRHAVLLRMLPETSIEYTDRHRELMLTGGSDVMMTAAVR